MKKYIKPNTDVTKVIFESNLMAGTNFKKLEGTTNDSDFSGLGKEETITSSNYVWDEEE